MRSVLNIAAVILSLVWLAMTVAPAGLSVCAEVEGKTQLGIGCQCATCDSAHSAPDRISLSCCDQHEARALLKQKCCQCWQLPVLTHLTKVKPKDAGSQYAVVVRLERLAGLTPPNSTATTQWRALCNPPPLLHGTTVLRL